MNTRSEPAHYIGIALVAAGVLAYQIVLMRLFAIESYASFGAMVISVAMLGFGLSGTLLTVLRSLAIQHRDTVLFWSAAITPPLLLVAHLIQQSVPFVPGKMLAEPEHAKWLAVYYVTALVPVFTASLFIGVTLVGFARDVHRLYFADLAASGVGAIILLAVLYYVPPRLLPLVPMVPIGLGAVAVARIQKERLIAMTILLLCCGYTFSSGDIKFNEYKGILGTLRTSDISGAEVIDERYGPMGFIQLVSSRSERTAPGLSAGTPFGVSPPEQHALFVDGEKVGSLARQLTDTDARYLDWLLSALPYNLLTAPNVLLLQVAGGESIVEALHHGAKKVRGVTTNPHFLDLMRAYRNYNGGLVERPEVAVAVGESRAVAETATESFDLVMMRGLDASGLSVSSTPGHSESYLLTVEAFETYLNALTEDGMIAVTMRLSVPPWKAIRLIPTIAAALRNVAAESPKDSVVFIRDTFLGLLVVKPSGFTATEVSQVRSWAHQRSFDLSYVPGIEKRETNLFTVLLDETYTDAAQSCLMGADACQEFMSEYLFDISPTQDDRPYFGHVVTGRTSQGLSEYQRKSVEALESAAPRPSADSVKAVVSESQIGLDAGRFDGDAVGSEKDTASEHEVLSNPGGLDGDDFADSEVDANLGGPDGSASASDDVAANPGGLDGDANDDELNAENRDSFGVESPDSANETAAADTGWLHSIRHIPVELWGAYLHWFTLIQAFIFALMIVVVPLFARTRVRRAPRKIRTLLFFACLGFGFMGAEMVLIRKLTLLLANPIFSVTIVLAAILVGSGIGSGYAGRFIGRGTTAIKIAALGIITTVALYLLFLDSIILAALGLSTAVRGIIAVLLIIPLAFFLGFPFPTALATLNARAESQSLVPWAWAINGATGVIAAVGAEMLITYYGFSVVLLAVLFCYAVAWICFPGRGLGADDTAAVSGTL